MFRRSVLSLALAGALGATSAQAAPIGSGQITPSTALGQYLYFSIGQLADGITSDQSPYNGYASGFGVVSGRITLALDRSYDLDNFVLWNDVNVLNEGVRSFTLTFQNAAGATIGSTGALSAVSKFDPQTYSFATVSGVKTVQLDVLSSNLQIEIRELAFNGTASVVPEPASAAMLLGGLAALGLRRRRLAA